MSNVLLVPVHVDALFLETDRQVTQADADFTKLPYVSEGLDVNPDVANLSEAILSDVFENQNFTLKKGIHLHWALPDALTRGVHHQGTDSIEQTTVPNRWLVTRTDGQVVMQWIVESDYLHPEGEANDYGAVSYPVDLTQTSTATQPFRYLGRQIPLAGWQEDDTQERLDALTAVGYGDPTFAAFYPNCHSVFGAYDPKYTDQASLAGVVYDVIGWYADASEDPLSQYIADLQATALSTGEALTAESLQQAIEEEFEWETPISDINTPPEAIFCYGQITFTPSASLENTAQSDPVTVSLGNTGLECLSAYLANSIVADGAANGAINDKEKVEEQLQAIQLLKKIGNSELDLGPRFREAFHNNEFSTRQGGKQWVLTNKDSGDDSPTSADSTTVSQPAIPLPAALCDHLNDLNTAQHAWEEKSREIQVLRQQLFSDWSKYMQSAYPPEDSHGLYPNVDKIRFYIQEKGLSDLDTAALAWQSLASDVSDQETRVAEALARFNQSSLDDISLGQLFDSTSNAMASQVVLTHSVWQQNTPLSDQCLAFNTPQDSSNASAYLAIDDSSETLSAKALSLWVYLDSVQANTSACLLNVPSASDAILSQGYFGTYWTTLYVNGQLHNPTLTYSWEALPKDQWVHLYLASTTAFSLNAITVMAYEDETNGVSDYFTGRLAGLRFFSEALSEDDIYTDMNMLGQYSYVMQEQTRGRFYAPKEPVVLLEGGAIEASSRHGFDGRLNEDDLLACAVVGSDSADNLRAQAVTALSPTGNEEKIGFQEWSTQPWHPLMLEWKAEVFPVAQGSNLHADGTYSDGLITDNFSLQENKTDLTPAIHTAVKTTRSTASIYSGRSLLTPYAHFKLQDEIESLLNNLQVADCYQVTTAISDADKASYDTLFDTWFAQKPFLDDTAGSVATFKAWYDTRPVYDDAAGLPTADSSTSDTHKANDPLYIALLAYEKILNTHFTSQALGGFNAALLQHRQVMQLPIADPLGFADYQTFSDTVRTYVGQESKIAPVPLNDFSPIRSGAMNLLEVRVIDTFGQIKTDIDPLSLVTTEKMKATGQFSGSDGRDRLYLPTRFVQPVRLNVRWWSAKTPAQEMNAHPDSHPICGWLLPNYLDSSLMVYDNAGYLLGLVDQTAHWQSAPGSEVAFSVDTIGNSHLQKLVARLSIDDEDDDTAQSTKARFIGHLITALGKALEDIDPENYAQHPDLAILMGRPIALVRASLDLQMQGSPAVNQSWPTFYEDLNRNSRATDGFENVKVPVRVGERSQLNDGVLGYWMEDAAGDLGDSFYTTIAAGTVSDSAIVHYEDDPLNLAQSPADQAQSLTLLMDPKGKVHATCAVAPAKVIDIPPAHYTRALQNIAITFRLSSLLTAKTYTALPLPKEQDYQWSWLQKEQFHWREIKTDGFVTQDSFTRAFDNGSAIWEALKTLGWIQEVALGKAKVVPQGQRTLQSLDESFKKQQAAIQAVLDKGYIHPIQTRATFKDDAVLKEGWLKLSPAGHTTP